VKDYQSAFRHRKRAFPEQKTTSKLRGLKAKGRKQGPTWAKKQVGPFIKKLAAHRDQGPKPGNKEKKRSFPDFWWGKQGGTGVKRLVNDSDLVRRGECKT